MKCKRCKANEDRIDGFCSIYCRDLYFEEEDTIDVEQKLDGVREKIYNLWVLSNGEGSPFCSTMELVDIMGFTDFKELQKWISDDSA